jgi:undecaprenyl-diphosphatase
MSSRASDAGALPLAQAVALGVLHGPAELLPVSSSAHITIVPWLLGSSYTQLDDELRKSFEVALHAGTAAALALALRGEVREAVAGLDRRRLGLLAASFLPAAVVGYTLERPIERRLGRPETIACGLAAGAVVMAVADRAPQRRTHEEAGLVDGLWLGVAQACSLMPGISRNGATLAAARLRKFTRPDANRLSRHAALPVIAGATVLKGVRLYRRGIAPGTAVPLAAGAGAAFVSTLGSRWLIGQVERNRSLAPYAAYRLGLAGLVVARLRRGAGRDRC